MRKEGVMEDLIEEKLQAVCSMGEVSTSLVQRKFKVGYSRAAKFTDKLEEEGIIEKQEIHTPRKILDKEKFIKAGKQYFSELFKFYHPDLKDIMDKHFPSIEEYVEIAETLIVNDCFAKKVDSVMWSKFSEQQNKEERKNSFHVSVYGNYCRSRIAALIVNDFISKSIKENLNYLLDNFWILRVKNYKSFLEEDYGKSNEDNESV